MSYYQNTLDAHMTLGTGIFLSTILVSIIVLFGMTKDRWNWKRIIIRSVGGLLLFTAITAGGFWAVITYNERPVVATELEGIKLTHTKDDVIFLKGAPDKRLDKENDNIWTYKTSKKYSSDESHTVVVKFEDDSVSEVYYLSGCILGCTRLSDIGVGRSYERVVEKFGEPTHTSTHKNKLSKVVSYKKYNVFFELEKNQVTTYGIFKGNRIFYVDELKEE